MEIELISAEVWGKFGSESTASKELKGQEWDSDLLVVCGTTHG